MLSRILALTLTAAPGDVVYNAPVNRFDTSEMSSEAIFAGMHICFEQLGGFSPERIPICGCLMDAARLNLKQGNRNTSPTTEQRAKCMVPPQKKPEQEKPKKGGKIGV